MLMLYRLRSICLSSLDLFKENVSYNAPVLLHFYICSYVKPSFFIFSILNLFKEIHHIVDVTDHILLFQEEKKKSY